MPETETIKNPPRTGGAARDALLTTAVLAAFVCLYVLMQLLLPFAQMREPVEFEIEKGMTFRAVTRVLMDKDLLRDPNLFVAMGRLTGLHRRVIPGVYSFEGSVSPLNVFRTVREGRVKLWRVTVLEGDMLPRIKELLAKDSLVTPEDFDRLSRDREFLARLGVNAPSLEGYIFPDTYMFSRGLKPEEVLGVMVRRTRVMLTDDVMRKAAKLGLDEGGVLTLASIIEREARVDDERNIISAVYHNRLRKGMRLQADPTVVYGIKEMSSGIRERDLLVDHPYNTYLYKGLPPGPISAPSRKSIEAAVNPADVGYIYFVSNYDGTHTFTSTYKEHLKAVKNFRIRRAMENRKPRNGESAGDRVKENGS